MNYIIHHFENINPDVLDKQTVELLIMYNELIIEMKHIIDQLKNRRSQKTSDSDVSEDTKRTTSEISKSDVTEDTKCSTSETSYDPDERHSGSVTKGNCLCCINVNLKISTRMKTCGLYKFLKRITCGLCSGS